MRHLFSEYDIKGCKLKNRIVMPGLASFLIEDGGTVTERTVEHYRRRAAGGPAMVIVEACAVSPEGVVSPHQARIDDDRFIGGLSKIAQAMRLEGCVPGIQIHHGGRQTSSRVIKQKPLAPSPLRCPSIRGAVEPLSIEKIKDLVKKFGKAAVRARDAGFEMVEIHGAHGYLVNQFLSGFSNIREDEYGGDITGRTRFAKEIVIEIKRRLGADFPLSFKISAQEFVENGLDVEQSIEILRILVAEGVDVVQVSAGNDATPEWISQPMFMKKACLADSAERIRRALGIPVMAVGRINDPIVAEDIIAKGKADLVCIGRGLLADPELPVKAKAGRFDDIRMCIACNTCMESIFRKGRVECLVNPSLGREQEMTIRPAAVPKKIMVVGGGPGGLNVAWVAASRGHEVHLFERQSKLGGQLITGSATTYKKELLNLIRFQKIQINRYGVNCHFEQEVDENVIRDFDPDALILATGSVPYVPSVEGLDRIHVATFNEILNGDSPPARKSVIIGGGATGCEVALHLCEHGSTVSVIEMLPNIGRGLESMTKKVLLRKIKEYGAALLTGYSPLRFEEDGVIAVDRGKNEVFIEADVVVFAAGSKPDSRLYDKVSGLGIEIHQIGDCLKPRSAKAAIYEGAVLGRSI